MSETTETDPVAVPRKVARAALSGLMSEVSENDWAAGWMDGTEDGIWAALVGHERGRNWPSALRWRGDLIALAVALGEWPNPTPDGEWVPLEVMEKRWGKLLAEDGLSA